MTAINYVLPNFEVIGHSRDSIRDQALVGSANIYIRALGEELINLNATITASDQQVSNSIASASIALETDALMFSLEALNQLSRNSPENSKMEAVKNYEGTLSKAIELCADRLTQVYTEVFSSLSNVESATITNNRFRLVELGKNLSRLDTELSAEQGPLNVLVTDEKILNEAIALFEGKSSYDRLKPLLQQLSGLIANGQAPQAMAIQAAVEVVFKVLDEANELAKYKDLLKARETLQSRISARKQRVHSLQAQLKDNASKTLQLTDAQSVVPHQRAYLDETGKHIETLGSFLKTIAPVPNESLTKTAQRLIEHSPSLRDYLQAMRRHWLRG